MIIRPDKAAYKVTHTGGGVYKRTEVGESWSYRHHPMYLNFSTVIGKVEEKPPKNSL